MEYEYKVGDWVRIIANKAHDLELDAVIGCIGKIIEIKELDKEFPYYVTIKDSIVTKDLVRYLHIHEKGNYIIFSKHEIELYQPVLKKFLKTKGVKK